MRKTREKKSTPNVFLSVMKKWSDFGTLQFGYVAEYWTSFIYMREEESAASRNEVL